MILRIEEATLRPGARARLVAELRGALAGGNADGDADGGTDGPVDGPTGAGVLTVGFRSVGGVTELLVASLGIEGSIGQGPAALLGTPGYAGLLDGTSTAIFELERLLGDERPGLDAPALGLIRGHVIPGREATAHEMIRAIADEVGRAGVMGLYTGRRIVVADEELIVVALWRDRFLLHEFARSRGFGAIDPRFAENLSRWSFVTYDCLSAGRLRVVPRGPALLLVDRERRLIDASPGAESVIGFPGELILGWTLDELSPEPDAMREAWLELERDGALTGTSTLTAPTGEQATVAWRIERHPRRADLTLIHLAPVDDATLQISLPELVAEAFPSLTQAVAS